MGKTLAAMLAAATVVCSIASGEVAFKTKPAVTAEGSGLRINFALDSPGDVEVSVLDEKGAVVRHLAAGLVGGPAAAPPLKAASLSQSILWDGKDDDGKVVSGKGRVRVRAGLSSRLGKVIGEPGRLTGAVYGLATDEKGLLYVASGGVYSGTPVYSIKVFDRKGKYLRTILPMPADTPVDRASEYGGASEVDGHLTPGNFNALVPYVQTSGVLAFIGNTVRDGVLWLINGEGKVCRVKSDGTPLAWKSAPKSVAPSGGPTCWAVSPDNKTLFLAGWWNKRDKTGDGVIRKIDPASGQATDFVTIDTTGNAAWINEPNGWYLFKCWSIKNGLAAIHGLAVDRQNRLYACDRISQRLAVYDAAGKLLGSSPIEFPDLVSLSPRDETVYVATRKVISGRKGINEFRVVKLSKGIDGQVLAEITLTGNDAPSMAVDATADPAVIWLSNVGDRGRQPVRIEDRGRELVVTGELNERLAAAKPIVKLWADPMTDDVYVNDGWAGLSRYDGLSGEGGPIPITAIDLAIGPDRNLYLYGQKGWKEPIYRCDLTFKPVPFSGTEKPTTGKTAQDGNVYGRFGTGFSNKGLTVGHDGRIYVRHMHAWNQYHVSVFGADGLAEKHKRVAGGIIGPVDSSTGGLAIDRAGNLYIGTGGHPNDAAAARAMEGCVIKVSPSGGGIEPKAGQTPGIDFGKYFFEGAMTAYPHLAPRQSRGCVCKEARFDLDEFGRLYVPDVLDFCVRVYDNAGNLIGRFGHYGNSDSAGPDSRLAKPAIPFGWPMTCGINRAGRLYVGDVLNQRIVRVDMGFRVEEIVGAD